MSPDEWKTVGGRLYGMGLNLNSLCLIANVPHGRQDHVLTEIKIQFKEEKCLVILKKVTPSGGKVAFYEAEDIAWALWILANGIKSKTVNWKEDKWFRPKT